MTRVNGLRFLIRAKTTMPSIGAILDIENSEGEVYAINIDECLAAIERGSYSIAFFGKNSVYQHQKVWFVVHEKKRRLHDALNRLVGVYYVVMVHAL